MKTIGTHNYYEYILTNRNKTVLYIGVTNNIKDRIDYHKRSKSSFVSKYNCFYLIYFEQFTEVKDAIRREKQLKGWKRIKKEKLINDFNSEWNFLNEEL